LFLAPAHGALDQYNPTIRQKVHENSPCWLPRAADEQLFVRLVEAVRAVLIEVQADDAWRARFEAATRELITNLENSAEYEGFAALPALTWATTSAGAGRATAAA
jgi:hypothetical protein